MDRVYRLKHGLAEGLLKRGGLGIKETLGLNKGPLAEEDEFLRSRSFEGRTVFDVGAFEGMHTIFFASRVGPGGRVFSFEPHPENRRTVEDHVALNELADRVTLVPSGVGARSGELRFVTIGDRGQTSADPAIGERLKREHPDAREIAAPVVALGEEVEAGRLPRPDFVKVDVEGLELPVLEGMRPLFEDATSRPELFVELHGVGDAAKRDNAQRVVALLLEHGYAVQHVETGSQIASVADAPPEGHLSAV